jgi:hypothetical protein
MTLNSLKEVLFYNWKNSFVLTNGKVRCESYPESPANNPWHLSNRWRIRLEVRHPQLFCIHRPYDSETACTRVIKDPSVLLIFERIIDSSPGAVGLPLGSLTSQLFANVNLNELDHYVKETPLRPELCALHGRFRDHR